MKKLALSVGYSYVYIKLKHHSRKGIIQHASVFLQTNKRSDAFNSKERSLSIKMSFVEMTLSILDEDERDE
jgi:hypothetical protein